MICPNCNVDLSESWRLCGGERIYFCKACKFERHQNTGQINLGTLHDWAAREAQFRRIVKRAFEVEGLGDIDQQSEFLEWFIGPDFRQLSYMVNNRSELMKEYRDDEIVDDWLSRINRRIKHVSGGASVFEVFRAGIREWKSGKIRELVH